MCGPDQCDGGKSRKITATFVAEILQGHSQELFKCHLGACDHVTARVAPGNVAPRTVVLRMHRNNSFESQTGVCPGYKLHGCFLDVMNDANGFAT